MPTLSPVQHPCAISPIPRAVRLSLTVAPAKRIRSPVSQGSAELPRAKNATRVSAASGNIPYLSNTGVADYTPDYPFRILLADAGLHRGPGWAPSPRNPRKPPSSVPLVSSLLSGVDWFLCYLIRVKRSCATTSDRHSTALPGSPWARPAGWSCSRSTWLTSIACSPSQAGCWAPAHDPPRRPFALSARVVPPAQPSPSCCVSRPAFLRTSRPATTGGRHDRLPALIARCPRLPRAGLPRCPTPGRTVPWLRVPSRTGQVSRRSTAVLCPVSQPATIRGEERDHSAAISRASRAGPRLAAWPHGHDGRLAKGERRDESAIF